MLIKYEFGFVIKRPLKEGDRGRVGGWEVKRKDDKCSGKRKKNENSIE